MVDPGDYRWSRSLSSWFYIWVPHTACLPPEGCWWDKITGYSNWFTIRFGCSCCQISGKVITSQGVNMSFEKRVIGHANQYPTIHYSGIPRHTQSMIAYKILSVSGNSSVKWHCGRVVDTLYFTHNKIEHASSILTMAHNAILNWNFQKYSVGIFYVLVDWVCLSNLK